MGKRYVNRKKRKRRKYDIIYERRIAKNNKYDVVVQIAIADKKDMIVNIREWRKAGGRVGPTYRGYSVDVDNFLKLLPLFEDVKEIIKKSGYVNKIKVLEEIKYKILEEQDIDEEDDEDYDDNGPDDPSEEAE